MTRKIFIAILGVWVFVFIFETLVHGFGLQSIYRGNDTMFRSPEEGLNFFPILLLGHLLLATGIVGLAVIFAKTTSVPRAAMIGGFIGVTFGVGSVLLQFVAQPVSANVAAIWAIAAIAEMTLAAVLAGALSGFSKY